MLPRFPGYRHFEVLFRGESTLVYRGRRARDGAPVVVKTCAVRPTPAEDTERLTREYRLLSGLDLPGVVPALALETTADGPALVLKDVGGRCLISILKEVSLSVPEVLDLAVQVADILESVHACGVAHLDVNPANFLVCEGRRQIWLCDFDAAILLSRDSAGPVGATAMRGTLAYIAPEQTGRMQREVDERADLYSLGVTLYQLLAGRLPFCPDDPIELVHHHIAERPVPLAQVSDRVPDALSAVVDKLLEKAPEQRYLSAFGVACDLRRCRDMLAENTPDPTFAPGERDVMTRFRPPEKLYGREAAAAGLRGAVERVSRGERLLFLVKGPSGVGKSVLVGQMRLSVLQARGLFVAGKYEQVQSDSPYRALIQALRELLGHVLSMDEDRVEVWRERIRRAVGPNGGVLAEVLPELTPIIGAQPGSEPLPATQASIRFTSLFLGLIRAFADLARPLVIFLDDLQWADAASLNLLRSLLDDEECGHLLVLGARRTPDPGGESPCQELLEALESHGGALVEQLVLEPLGPDVLGVMLAELFRRDDAATGPLAKVLFEKTRGNPFFIRLFLQSLADSRLLRFDLARGQWDWSLEAIRDLEVTANVALFMSQRIHLLPSAARELLELAACIGSRFDLDILSRVCGQPTGEVAQVLGPALADCFVQVLGEGHEIVDPGTATSAGLRVRYRFVHDRVQQAAYERLSGSRQAQLHYRIGRLMLERLSRESGAQLLSSAVDQLNRGRELAAPGAERLDLARLNLETGRAAKASAAFVAALHYFDIGVSLLPRDAWTIDPALALGLHRERAEALYLTGDLHAAETAFDALLERDLEDLEKARLYHIRMILSTAIGRFSDAIAQGLTGLALLGVRLPERPTAVRLLLTHMGVSLRLRGSDPARLARLEDPAQELVLELLMALGTPCYLTGSENLLGLSIVGAVDQSLKHGIGRASALAFSGYAGLLASVLGNPSLGNWLGAQAGELAGESRVLWYRSKTLFTLSTFVRPWHHPFGESAAMMQQAFQDCLDSGDNLFGCYTAIRLAANRFYMGDPLEQVEADAQRNLRFIRATGDQAMIDNARLWLQFYRALQGCTTTMLDWDNEDFRVDVALGRMRAAGYRSGQIVHAVCRAYVELLTGDFQGAIARIRAARPQMSAVLGLTEVALAELIEALSLASLQSGLTGLARARCRLELAPMLRRLKRWARSSPANFEAAYLLVRAEHAAASGRTLRALQGYQQAASRAGGGLVQEGMCREWWARFCHRSGLRDSAREQLLAAIKGYRRWGAEPKAQALEETLADWEPDIATVAAEQGSRSTSSAHLHLDLDTVIRAAETISGEILSERLLERLIELVVSNAGAERGVLLLRDDSGLRVQAELKAASRHYGLLMGTPLDDYDALPRSVVRFVERSRQTLVLGDAAREGGYAADRYIRGRGVRSVLCLAILRQGKLIAVLYLENNLAPGVFTDERVRLLSLLSSQMAISIENAELYRGLRRAADDLERYNRELEDKVQERTAALEQALVRVEHANAEVLDSLAYAKMIQESLLPGPDALRTLGQDRFLLWLPRDIVGGDIYCLYRVGGVQVLVLADCTGHGVPGALMTVIAVSALRQIVQVEGCVDPSEILHRLNVEVRGALGQDDGTRRADNGMDAAVCCLHAAGRLRFAGARLGVHLVHDGKLLFHAGDHHSIGYLRSAPELRFRTHDLAVESGAWVYLASDGYEDQLGGARGFPMGRSRLRSALNDGMRKPGEVQRAHLLQALDAHRGERPRQDDVTLIGLQI